MRGIISSFLFALVTNRALIVHFSTGPYHSIKLGDLFEGPGFDWIAQNPLIQLSSTHIHPRNELDMEKLLCSNYDVSWPQEVVHIEGNFYWTTFIEKNPLYDDFMSRYFFRSNVGQQLHHVLFQPHPEVVQAKEDWLLQHGVTSHKYRNEKIPLNHTYGDRVGVDRGKYLVSMQLRNDDIRNGRPQISADEYTSYMQCSLANIPHFVSKENIIWFIATDSAMSRAESLKQFVDRQVVFYGKEFLTGGSVEGLRQALVDILIASEAQQIYLSPWSSYGRMISLYNTDSPLYLVTDNVLPVADVHRTFSPVEEVKHCYHLLSREECPWFEIESHYSKEIKRVTCYNPAMTLDFC